MTETQTTTWDRGKFLDLTEFREVEEVLRRGKDFVVTGTKAGSEEFSHGTILATDGRTHLARRRALMRMIGPNQPWGAEGTLVDEVFAHNLHSLRETSVPNDNVIGFDLVEFYRQITWRVTAALVGIDGIDDDATVAEFERLAGPIVEGLNVEYFPEERHPQILAAARTARQRVQEDLFDPSLERRRKIVEASRHQESAPDEMPADLLTSMLIAAGDEEPDTGAIFREMVVLLAGSVNNPVSMTVWALDDLLPWLDEHPEFRDRATERDFLNRAVTETLRLHRASRPHLVRIATDDTVLESSGRRIPKGQWVSCWLQAANRDPSVFGPEADRYDPYRTPLDPEVPPFGIGFGAGPHTCLGRPLVLWEQGGSHAQGLLIKLMRFLLAEGLRIDPNGVQQEDGPAGGRRFTRYDVLIRA
jgi:cytochrome P450